MGKKLLFILLISLFATALHGQSPGDYSYRYYAPIVYADPPKPMGGYTAIEANILYPDNALAIELEGTVTIRCTINADGNAVDVRPVLGPRMLYDAAIRAVEWSQWLPARIDGEPCNTEVTFELNFHLPGTVQPEKKLPPLNMRESLLETFVGLTFTGMVVFLLSLI